MTHSLGHKGLAELCSQFQPQLAHFFRKSSLSSATHCGIGFDTNMTVSWKTQPHSFYICFSLCFTSVLSQELTLEPGSATVLTGSVVRFKATVPGAWEVMTWQVSSLLVLTVSPSSSSNVTSSSEQFSARFCSQADTSCVEFTIQNVSRSQAGPLVCSVLGIYGSKTANLSVQESGSINITGGAKTVEKDQQVEFQCLTSGWYPQPTIGWSLDNITVNSSLYSSNSMAVGDSFNSTSVLMFQAASSTTVECWATVAALSSPASSRVFLAVVPKPPDWTVLIALVVSVTGFALLMLLIYGIFFCYKRRKGEETSYQDEMMRRVRSQSQRSDVVDSKQGVGKDNEGYESEDQTSRTHTGAASRDRQDADPVQAKRLDRLEMLSAGKSDQPGNEKMPVCDNVEDSVFMKHRHATVV